MTPAPESQSAFPRSEYRRPSRSLLRRAVVAFVLLPGIVAFGVPLTWAWLGEQAPVTWLQLVAIVPGVLLLWWCVREFYVTGHGTLAPWSPPEALVTTGPYARSRNPMYVAVVVLLCGWAVAFASGPLAIYAAAVAVAFHVRVVWAEEPRLSRTYGTAWAAYRARVPRWIGRARTAT